MSRKWQDNLTLLSLQILEQRQIILRLLSLVIIYLTNGLHSYRL